MPIRVYELAKKYDLSSKDLIKALHGLGISVESHMSVLSPEAESAFEKHVKPSPAPAKDPVKKDIPATPPMSSVPAVSAPRKNTEKQAVSRKSAVVKNYVKRDAINTEKIDKVDKSAIVSALALTSMSVAEFAQKTGKPLGEVIGVLLRQRAAIAKNQMLSEDLVEKLAGAFGIPLQEKSREALANDKSKVPSGKAPLEAGIVRQPIVVVMGHVDHGKTTLLDTIRKTRVAAREKGGITQHLGAYEVEVASGKITFLDTPGHAAFSMIRSRGAHIADIAILVVAADDGIKPQTLEALQVAQAAHIPIVVAINKIDRATPAQVEVVKRELAQRGLVPEDWGGQTIMVPIAAKTGQGVNALLEMISLQAQMMELSASTTAKPHGFIIESTVERGMGFVATVIVREGTFRVGDYLVSDETEGRIVAIINAQGQRVTEALPAVPVLIAGFKSLPSAGEEIHKVDSLVEREQVRQVIEQRAPSAPTSGQEDELRIIIKADNASSLEAVAQTLRKGFKGARPIVVVSQGVGPISERDITYAQETGALLYGLHVKWETRARELAQRSKTDAHMFDIIYALLDDVAVKAQPKRSTQKVMKKIGEALVLKVFDIKKMGVIAGSIIKSGIFTRNGSVKIFRGKQEVGGGAIKSLQRDRKPVKEVHAGYECAFLVEGFSDWHESDRVECFQETIS